MSGVPVDPVPESPPENIFAHAHVDSGDVDVDIYDPEGNRDKTIAYSKKRYESPEERTSQ